MEAFEEEASPTEEKANTNAGRRRFLQGGAAVAFGSMFPLELLAQLCEAEADLTYGGLSAVGDENAGFSLKLPGGSTLWSFSSTGQTMADGVPAPGLHDGMGICRESTNGIITLVRNHEVKAGDPLDPPHGEATADAFTEGLAGFTSCYDPAAPGGTTTLKFDRVNEEWVEARSSLSGTIDNCAGGNTPWGTWLTCEEDLTINGSGASQKKHGYVFEVRTDGSASSSQPITAMGRFLHEAAAVVDRRVTIDLDPGTGPVELEPETASQHGDVYLTEDAGSSGGNYVDCGFYLFVPSKTDRSNMQPGDLNSGTLKIMRHNTTNGKINTWANQLRWRVKFEDVGSANLDRPFGKKTNKMAFKKTEGAFYDRCEHAVWIVAGNSGKTTDQGKFGRIFKYNIGTGWLDVMYDSYAHADLSFPDNMTRMKDGSLLFCEDTPQNRNPRIRRINFATEPPTIATLVEFDRAAAGYPSNFDAEFTGVCLSDDNKFLFFCLQRPSVTFAVKLPEPQTP